jgi:hypothetical protein
MAKQDHVQAVEEHGKARDAIVGMGDAIDETMTAVLIEILFQRQSTLAGPCAGARG